MFMGLQPVSLSYIPREGEYDVICHHCSSSVDSLHQSISERNEDSPQSTGSQTKSCPGAFFNPPPGCDVPPTIAKAPYAVPYPMLGQPPFHPTLQNPFLGLYMLDMPVPAMPHNIVPGMAVSPVAGQKLPSPAVSNSSSPDSVHSEAPKSVDELPGRPDTPATSMDPEEDRVLPHLTETQRKISRAIAESLCSVDPQEDRMLPDLSPGTQMKISQAIAASLCSVRSVESIASERSLTAAVEQMRKRMAAKAAEAAAPPYRPVPSTRQSSMDETNSKNRSSKALYRYQRAQCAKKRRAKNRRRRRAAKTDNIVSEPKAEPPEPKPEQVNSATRRRDRRERMAQGKNDKNSGDSYWHMMMIPGLGSGAPHR